MGFSSIQLGVKPRCQLCQEKFVLDTSAPEILMQRAVLVEEYLVINDICYPGVKLKGKKKARIEIQPVFKSNIL